MADTIIIYYSLEGNVDFLAKELSKELSKELGADLCRLETVKEYPKKGLAKFFHGGKDVVYGIKPELKTALPDLSKYSSVILGTPVWAAKPVPPMNTFFDSADFSGKNVSIFASSGGGNSKKCLSIMRETVTEKGGNLVAEEDFCNPLKKQEESLTKLKAFAERIKK
ncbi:flavodoxin [uncultured Treponema sp.]|uniref:flavodoxin family protein n=1 Tax=uncultured Treponema sp. TaxID=162155 RepID=UPI0025DD8F68|nr:flavodoxin [uncultured Treponema sp.]